MSYRYTLNYTRPDGSKGAVMGGHEEAMMTVAMMDKDTAYYEELGYTVDECIAKKNCPACEGAGKVEKKQRGKRMFRTYIDCPTCKGDGLAV